MRLRMLRDEFEFFEASETLLTKNVGAFIINATVIKAVLLWSLKWPVWRRVWKIRKERLVLLLIGALCEILKNLGGEGF
jgi:hypothetical protein